MPVDKYIYAVESELEKCCDKYFYNNSQVAKAARYSLLKAGKRTRAVLILLTADMCGADWHDYLSPACAVEMVHCYSLIHDDLPCMDDDDLRRGKPSCHKAFGEATALLAGDALLGCGAEVLSHWDKLDAADVIKAVQALCAAMGPKGMIYGQELDSEYENKAADGETLSTIHKNKTGRMISLCGTLGSLGCQLSRRKKIALEKFFANVGLVFQIVDDILDVEGDTRTLGKPRGSDENNNKSTFITLYGLEKSKEMAADMTREAENVICEAFGDAADNLMEYTKYLLNRKK